MLLKEFLPAPVSREFVKRYRIVHFKFDRADDVPAKCYPPNPKSAKTDSVTEFKTITDIIEKYGIEKGAKAKV